MFGKLRLPSSWYLLPESVRDIPLGFVGVVGGFGLLYVFLLLLPTEYPATWAGILLAILVAVPFFSWYRLRKLRIEHAMSIPMSLSNRLRDFKRARALFMWIEIGAAAVLVYGITNAIEPFTRFHVNPKEYFLYDGLHFRNENGVLSILLGGSQLWAIVLSIAGIAATYAQFAKPISRMDSEEFRRKVESDERLF
jgi:hypothetical protein